MGQFDYNKEAWEAEIRREVRDFSKIVWKEDPEVGCPACGWKGMISTVGEENGHHTRRIGPCSCRKLKRQEQRLNNCGMPELLKTHTFDNYIVQQPWQKNLLDTVEGAADKDNWVLLCGQSGCGKTHLATALCRELICRDKRVYCIGWPETTKRLSSLAQDYVGREKMLSRIRETEVLLIDDLFKNCKIVDGLPEVGKSEMDNAFEIIESRYRNSKRTIITTELQPKQLVAMNEALYGRIKERCGACVKTVISARDRDWRTKLPS